MKPKTKNVLGGCAIALVLAGLGAFVVLWYVVPTTLLIPTTYSPEQMWHITHEWTRTAPLPPEVTNKVINSSGSDFTRQFRASFRWKDRSSLEAWMAASPGFADATVMTEPDGTRIYQIKPGGGALFSQITIHPDLRVKINTYWS